MKSMPRILANLLLPPCIATLLLLMPAIIFGAALPRWREVAMVIPYAYAFAAIPSIIHTVVMERFYRRGLQPTDARAVGVSAVSGLLAGILLSVIFAATTSLSDLPRFWPYPLLGSATGAVIAFFILVISRARTKNA